MLNIKPRYLVDENGRKTGAVLSMKDYRRLMQRLEDLEDALDLGFGNTRRYGTNCGDILTDSGTYVVLLERRAEREFRKLPTNVMARLDVVFRELADNPRPSGVVKLSEYVGRISEP